MATTTTPDNIYVLESSDPDEPLAWQPAMATSVQNALNSRALQTFRWANATERNAQVGMREGDMGLQEDSGRLYTYTSSAWQAVLRNYVWANDSARNGQTGMIAGDFGYQSDIDKVFVYTGSAWRRNPNWNKAVLTLTQGVANTGYLAPSVTLSDDIVTLTGRIDNGNGLTLSSSFQTVAVAPTWARPALSVAGAAMNAGTGPGIIRVGNNGNIDIAISTGVSATFSFSYPLSV